MLINDLHVEDDNTITLPYKFTPREYQLSLMRAMIPELFPPVPTITDIILDREPSHAMNVKNAVAVWHRRAGKDKCSINILICRAMIDTPGYYLYMAPEAAQARKIIWQGIGSDGMKFIDHIPPEIIKTKRDQEMYVELINGSVIQIGGADNYDSLVGTNPRGIIFSEYSIQNPAALQYFRPMLVENKGWALFIYTSRGHNHGWDLRNTAKARVGETPSHPDWFYQCITIDESKREDGTPVITQQAYLDEIANGMPEATAKQEFYCDFDQGMPGAYYADIISKLHKTGAIGYFPHDPMLNVVTAWDLGLNDSNAIWFIQVAPSGPRVINYMEESNVPMTEWVKRVQEQPYNYFDHIAPHDITQRDPMTGFNRLEKCKELGLYFTVAPKLSRADGIEASRALLPICQFDETSCRPGIEALMGYERIYDEKLRRFKDTPHHNWCSHGADSWRYFAILWDDYKDMNSPIRPHYVIKTSGEKQLKNSGSLPPLRMGGVVHKNGEYYGR